MSTSNANDSFRYRLNEFSQFLGVRVAWQLERESVHGGNWTATASINKISWGTGKDTTQDKAKEIAAKTAFDQMCAAYPQYAHKF